MLKALLPVSVMFIFVAVTAATAEDRELTFHSGTEFAAAYEKQIAQGFRPIDLAMFTEKQTARLAVLWAKRQQPEFHVQVGISVDDFQEKTNELRAKGFRMARVAADRAGANLNYSAIWEKSDEPVHVRVGFATAKFKADAKQLFSEGSCPLHLTVSSVNGAGYYSCLWDIAGEPKRELERDLTQTQVTRAIPKREKDGFRILQVCGYAVGKADRYACVWERSKGPMREVTIRQTQTGLVRALKRMQAKGLQPDRISVYPAGGQTRFAVVWDEE
ncbi:MAG: hypothetical protein H8E37_04090 [Planctomycetes bacterium]|nr:hypothetical protein [Planctomycetota bacterium]